MTENSPFLPRRRVQTHPVGESRTEQHHKGMVDINRMVQRYQKTGLLPQRGTPGFYGDFTQVSDYQSCLHAVHSAQDAFMALPAQVRKEFDNDPAKLLVFLDNPANADKAMELGIIPRPEPVQPEPDPVTPEPAE